MEDSRTHDIHGCIHALNHTTDSLYGDHTEEHCTYLPPRSPCFQVSIDSLFSPLPGGALECQGGAYQARPKIHVIRVVFQDQALYARISFRGSKTCKIGKKGCVFGYIDKFWNEHDRQIKKNAYKNASLHDRQIKKNAYKNAYLGSFFGVFPVRPDPVWPLSIWSCPTSSFA